MEQAPGSTGVIIAGSSSGWPKTASPPNAATAVQGSSNSSWTGNTISVNYANQAASTPTREFLAQQGATPATITEAEQAVGLLRRYLNSGD